MEIAVTSHERQHGSMSFNTPPCTDGHRRGSTGTPPFMRSAREGKVEHTCEGMLAVLPYQTQCWLTKSTQCWLTILSQWPLSMFIMALRIAVGEVFGLESHAVTTVCGLREEAAEPCCLPMKPLV